jgi:dTDP-4-amino-4,6-dideoxygalactose transaminase
MKSKLALFGGPPVISHNFKPYVWVEEDDVIQVAKILKNSTLSGFLAQPTQAHLGGEFVRKLEEKWCEQSGALFSVTFNSWTSGLEAAVASLGLPKGGEVIVPSWTMSASISSITLNGLIPKFIDITYKDFTLDVDLLDFARTEKTVAVLGVDIFGRLCNGKKIQEFCNKHSLKLIIDSAQAPLAQDTFGFQNHHYADISGYSFNRHKHLQVGEGGIAVTNDQNYCRRMRLLRNHSEVTYQVDGEPFDLHVPYGHNWRLGEVEAFLALQQLQRIQLLVNSRRDYARSLIKYLNTIPELILDDELRYTGHDYYILGFRLNEEFGNLDREQIVSALRAEGIPSLITNYSNLHNIVPFKNFPRTQMTVTENLNNNLFIGLYMCGFAFSQYDIALIGEAFIKVFKNLQFFVKS